MKQLQIGLRMNINLENGRVKCPAWKRYHYSFNNCNKILLGEEKLIFNPFFRILIIILVAWMDAIFSDIICVCLQRDNLDFYIDHTFSK